MIKVRKANERGHADHGWLNTYHTFSFASYHDPNQMGFRSLRVMNEDRVAPGKGFGEHMHKNMEIVSYVLDGALEHKDSMGNGEVLTPGEFQRMSAGTGITHSEFNPSSTEPTHFYQIWLLPEREGISPSYEQKRFDDSRVQDRFCLVASPDGEEESLTIHQDVRVYLAKFAANKRLLFDIVSERHAWVQVLRGSVSLNGTILGVSDGAAVSHELSLTFESAEDTELMLFDLT